MILATTFAYNEVKYLDEWVNYYSGQGCHLFVLDHMSNDGTFERLQKLGIDCARVDTGGSFHLDILQRELDKFIHRIKPDWVVYAGIDLFHIPEHGLKNTIEFCSQNGYNKIQLDCWSALHRGEPDETPLHKNFFFAERWRPLTMIARYDRGFKLNRDDILTGSRSLPFYDKKGLSINYGACKPIAEQEEKLKRRRKAWREGLNRTYGQHFEIGKRSGWRYEGGIDLRGLEQYELITKYLK